MDLRAAQSKGFIMNQQQTSQLNQQIAAQLKNAENAKCEECSCTSFSPVFIIKRLSALISPTGQDMNVPIQLFQCTECKHVNKEWLPDEEDEQTKS